MTDMWDLKFEGGDPNNSIKYQSYRAVADILAVLYESHALASTSGMLGFKTLSDASIALETACRARLATPGSIIPALADVLSARTRAREILARILAEEVSAS